MGGHQHLAAAQVQAADAFVEAYVQGGVAVQHQLAAVGKQQGATLADGGLQLGAQRIRRQGAQGQPAAGSPYQQGGEQAQGAPPAQGAVTCAP